MIEILDTQPTAYQPEAGQWQPIDATLDDGSRDDVKTVRVAVTTPIGARLAIGAPGSAYRLRISEWIGDVRAWRPVSGGDLLLTAYRP